MEGSDLASKAHVSRVSDARKGRADTPVCITGLWVRKSVELSLLLHKTVPGPPSPALSFSLDLAQSSTPDILLTGLAYHLSLPTR